MDLTFIHEPLPARVIFGRGTLPRVVDEAERLGLRRLLVLCGREQGELARTVRHLLGDRAAGLFEGAAMHTPVEVTREAVALCEAMQADGVVAVGGGSSTGLAKAIALRTDLPQIIVPTTYAGSEMTPLLGETEDRVKRTQRTLKVLPESVVYDVDLTMTLPPALSAASGLNAIAHAVEALYAPDRSPVVSLMAQEGVRALYSALPRVIADPANPDARRDALYGAWLCACCLGAVTMGLHHKLCHVLGGLHDLPHAALHAILLPHVLAYNSPSAPDALGALRQATGHERPALALQDLGRSCGIPVALREIGMPEQAVDRAVELVLAGTCSNPTALDRESLRRLLRNAWLGTP